ncbi:MAG: SMP-30/gluconolactonase/LRE family protein, partial [Pirellulaceae bacterium]|nr:SMP-30/gluconolactonase/LRE family protein [Pirellulaceae bacterium]
MIVRRSSICLTIACCAGALVIAGRLDADDDAKPELPASHSVAPQLHATGFEFAEGPAVNPKSGDLFVVNYRGNGRIGRIATDGTAQVWCDLRVAAPLDGRSPQANGLKIDNEQRIVAADAGGGRLLRISRDGKQVEVLADRWKGKRFDAVNDVALDAAGNIYFSDPGESTYDNPIGSVYRYSIRTKQVTRIDDELAYPNGLAVTPD